jgi:hypothetical protein
MEMIPKSPGGSGPALGNFDLVRSGALHGVCRWKLDDCLDTRLELDMI